MLPLLAGNPPALSNLNPNGWLKTSTYVVPNLLPDYCIKNNIVDDDHKKALFYIVHMILCSRNWNSVDDQGYARISRDVWLDKLGYGYKKYFDELVAAGIILIDLDSKGKERYSYLRQDATPEEIANFIPLCKGFKLSPAAMDSGISRHDFKKRRIYPLQAQTSVYKKNNEEDSICVGVKLQYTQDPALEYQLECCKEIAVRSELLPISDPIAYGKVKDSCEKINWGAVALHRSNTGRVFDVIIEMERIGRGNLVHKSGESFLDIDVKSCHFYLMLPLFSDKKEKERFKRDLEGDIYKVIHGDFPDEDRDEVKRKTIQVITCKDRNLPWIQNTPTGKYFQSFPVFYKEHLSKVSTLAFQLQQTESKIVTQDLVIHAKNSKCFIKTMHDGFLCLPKDKENLCNKLSDLLFSHCGCMVPLKVGVLGNPNKMYYNIPQEDIPVSIMDIPNSPMFIPPTPIEPEKEIDYDRVFYKEVFHYNQDLKKVIDAGENISEEVVIKIYPKICLRYGLASTAIVRHNNGKKILSAGEIRVHTKDKEYFGSLLGIFRDAIPDIKSKCSWPKREKKFKSDDPQENEDYRCDRLERLGYGNHR